MIVGESSPLPWHQDLRHILRPYEHMLQSYFDEEKLQTLIAWMAAQSGPPPTEPFTGPFPLWHALYHEGGVARPKDGSGMLKQALRSHVESHGGDVYTGAPVEEILVEDGRAVGIRVREEILTCRGVYSPERKSHFPSLQRCLPTDNSLFSLSHRR